MPRSQWRKHASMSLNFHKYQHRCSINKKIYGFSLNLVGILLRKCQIKLDIRSGNGPHEFLIMAKRYDDEYLSNDPHICDIEILKRLSIT